MPPTVGQTTATPDELRLVAAIRGGDERAFAAAVDGHYAGMLAVAKAYVGATETARQVVHDAWTAALAAADRFDGGTPLRAWLLRFVVDAAAPLVFARDGARPEAAGPAVAPDRFRSPDDAFPGHWRAYPLDWRSLPEDVRRGEAARGVVEAAVAALPVEQRAVITLRDVVGCPAHEAYAILDVPESLGRERLHQARCRVRAVLERHFDD